MKSDFNRYTCFLPAETSYSYEKNTHNIAIALNTIIHSLHCYFGNFGCTANMNNIQVLCDPY